WTERGTRRRISVTADTQAQAKRKLRDRLRELEAGETSVSSRTTVKAWAAEWLPIVERNLRPGAYSADRSALRIWIVPTIGHKRLDKLTPADIRAVADAQRAAGRTPSTQRRTRSTLTQLLKAARAEGHAVPARVLEVKAPAPNPNDRTDLSVEQAVAVLGIAAELPHGSRWVAALLQGMRQAECLGLTWDQVDLERRMIVLSWQLKPLPYRAKYDRDSGFRVPDDYDARQLEGRMHLVRPKSAAGHRVIPLVPWMVAALEKWRAIAPSSPHGLVWPAADGSPADQKADDAEWYALQGTAGVGHPAGRWYTVHEARHTTATLLLEAGVDPAIITAILGHATIVTSRGYMHVNTAPLAAAMERVAERLSLA
ncbi:MAG: tyrosine-type recombinase/integrase, partial [Sciscionella sp.]